MIRMIQYRKIIQEKGENCRSHVLQQVRGAECTEVKVASDGNADQSSSAVKVSQSIYKKQTHAGR